MISANSFILLLSNRSKIFILSGWFVLFNVVSLAETHNLEIAQRYRIDKMLIENAHIRYEISIIPTLADNYDEIKKVCKLQGRGNEYKYFIITKENAEKRYAIVDWYRKNEKEQSYTFRDKGEKKLYSSRYSFDGNIISSLSNSENSENSQAFINSIESYHWYQTNRTNPYSLILEYNHIPYSQIIERAQDYKYERVINNNEVYYSFRFRHPDFDEMEFKLLFDELHRLIERILIVKLLPNYPPITTELHEFNKYKLIEADGGNMVWFPMESVYHYYIGENQNGVLVEYQTNIINVLEIDLVQEIPDESFVIEFPAGAIVTDKIVGGRSYLEKESLEQLLQDKADDIIKEISANKKYTSAESYLKIDRRRNNIAIYIIIICLAVFILVISLRKRIKSLT